MPNKRGNRVKMSKLNWNRLGFFVLGAFLGQMVLGGIFGAVRKVG